MGLSSSQARLLTITARLTSNEYESQQISNAKMRLATQSQDASAEYISALNKQVFNIVSFDNNGNQVSTPLTTSALYEYNDTKNQYLLTNSAGKVYLSHKDIENYKSSKDLEAFLSKYGLNKIFKTEALKNAYNDVKALQPDLEAYKAKANTIKASYNADAWIIDKSNAQVDYINYLNKYNLAYDQLKQGKNVTEEDVESAQTYMEDAKLVFMHLVSYESAIEYKLIGTTEYDNYQKYKTAYALYTDELDHEGVDPANAYQWDDQTKAQWYTNLWYRINGSSTGNMHTTNYIEMDTKMMNSTNWVSDSIQKGTVRIEAASFERTEMTLKYDNDPFIFTLNGIEWNTKIYSACPDIVAADNEKAVAQAEAEYQRKTAEINAKDEKYQRKLNLLDTEHNAMQTEYESVKSAMDKNISRSFKTFQG